MFPDMDNEKEKDLNEFFLHPRDMSVEYKVTKMYKICFYAKETI